MPKPRRQVGVRGKHRLLLPPEGVLVVMGTRSCFSPGTWPQPPAASPRTRTFFLLSHKKKVPESARPHLSPVRGEPWRLRRRG